MSPSFIRNYIMSKCSEIQHLPKLHTSFHRQEELPAGEWEVENGGRAGNGEKWSVVSSLYRTVQAAV